MRLIDADALIDRIKNPYEQAQVARWVNEQPTIEPEKRTEKRTETHACDLIDRQAAIDDIKAVYEWHDTVTEDRILDHLYRLPSAQPEPKKGKWIDKSGGIEGAWNYCSICGEQAIDLYDYCPNCGADMRGEQNERNC